MVRSKARKLDPNIETCGCQSCRSDLAYIVPCHEKDQQEAKKAASSPQAGYQGG